MRSAWQATVPGCLKVLTGKRIRCGISCGTPSRIKFSSTHRIEIEGLEKTRTLKLKKIIRQLIPQTGVHITAGDFATEKGIIAGTLYAKKYRDEKKLDCIEIRHIAGIESVECASALYGGIVFLLDENILCTFNRMLANHVLCMFPKLEKDWKNKKESKNKPENNLQNAYLDFLSNALKGDMMGCSEALENIQGTAKFWRVNKKFLKNSIFWGFADNGIPFAILPADDVISQNPVTYPIDVLGVRMEEDTDND